MDVVNVLDGIRFESWFGPEMDEPVNPLGVQRQARVENQFDVVAVEPMIDLVHKPGFTGEPQFRLS